MPDTPSITLVKSFTYRGAPEEWSNTYHFEGTTPATDAEWRALALAIYATEKAIFTPNVTLVHAYGYEAGNETSVAQIDLRTGANANTPGTLSIGSNQTQVAGDQAAWIRARIGVSSSGKKVYIRKYFHGIGISTSDADTPLTSCRTAMAAHAAAMLAGGLPGGATWCGPQGQDAIEPVVASFVTTRTLKRRGKRP